MPLSGSVEYLLALAEVTSPVDDDALAVLGRRVLEAAILDPKTPDHLREAAMQVLRRSNGGEPSVALGASDDATN